ncbi:sugar transferase [Formosa agariphila KMM 3901]|uniref:Sugar transferase n=1 Tax=Formosa agariphila (strain DSM 15362 / KCTC 12365 / LMG 23005 / KMM 3901 / M-2Alg 35-1) TaxID=1347342 RepID=T2KNH0_FORAG|nr:sugar transferase [Formosa agariphila]CDF80013.1 sugar transferase [Formosa agariphila KMM 3901]
MSNNLYSSYLKRALDLTASVLGFLALSPIFIILTIVIWIDFKTSPFFFQERPGKDEKVFKIIKFKSMNNKKDAEGNLLSNRERTTKLGRVIRKYSLDEIPQLLNVINGDMSLIGPRPLVVLYLPYYNEIERKRHSVRPGITGLAQVKGRNSLVWEERFALDVEYVENLSLSLDIKILYWTIQKLFSKSEVAIDQDEFLDWFNVYRKKQWEADKTSKLS